MRLLVTGAAGFIGSFLSEGGLERGFEVWAGVRKNSSRQYITNDAMKFATIDLGCRASLRAELLRVKAEFGGWDYIIHAAGATKCRKREDFFRTNLEGTKMLVEELMSLDMQPKMFVYISSLSVFGPIREDISKGSAHLYSPISETDTPNPDTAYGLSKLSAERWLDTLESFPHIVLRPTGVYGPREKDYFLMAKSIKQHIDFSVGYKKQVLTFVYVRDLVNAAFLALEKGKSGRKYFVTDGYEYDGRDFSDLLQRELGVKAVLHIKAPLWFLKSVCVCSEMIAKFTKRASTLNGDKYKIMKQRNWMCSISPIVQDLGYRPEYPLERGVKEAVAWYKKEGWI